MKMAKKNESTNVAQKQPSKNIITKKPAQKDRTKQIGSYIDLISKCINLVNWPIVAIIIIILFYSPFKRIVELIPGKFEQSSEISIGTILSLKIQEQAKASGNEELATIIEGLSKDSIEWILKIGDGSYRVIGSDDGGTGIAINYFISPSYSVWIELYNRGLITSTVDLFKFKVLFNSLGPINDKIPVNSLTEQQKDQLLNNYIELSDSGKKAYEIIIKVITDSIGQG
jgi:hypothetical protein